MDSRVDIADLLRHADWVRALALRLCGDAHGADDATQDAWVAALDAPPRHTGNVRGYLAALLRNGRRMRLRSERRRHAREVGAASSAVDPTTGEPAAEAAARAELHQRLVALVLALPEPQRALVLLHYFEGHSIEALAHQRRATPDAVRAHLRRARDSLRAQLEREPTHRRTLHALAPLSLVPHTLATSTVLLTTLMKLKFAAVAVVGLTATALLWPSRDPEALATEGSPTPRVAAALTAPGNERARSAATPAREAATAEPTTTAQPTWRVRLRGLHRDAPWTATLRFALEGRDEARQEWLNHVERVALDGDQFALPLPPWHAAATLLQWQLDAEDQHYTPVQWRHRGEQSVTEELLLDVQVLASLRGRVVDERGAPVPGARVSAFAVDDGQALDRRLGRTNTRADGKFTLRVPPDVPLLAVAAAMGEASLSGMRMTMRDGSITDDGRFRADLLPAARMARGSVGRAHALEDLVLPAAATIRGTVRWSDGRAIAKATVRALPFDGRTLDLGDGAHVQVDARGAFTPVSSTSTDASGAFAVAALPGVPIDVGVGALEGHTLLGGLPTVRASAPQSIELTVALPTTVRVVRDGLPVPTAELAVAGHARASLDAEARVQLVVGATPARVQARAGAWRSRWLELSQATAGQALDLPLEHALAEVQVEFAGDFRVRNARFSWRALPDGTESSEHLLRDDRSGPFRLHLQPGRYRLRVTPAGGERNGLYLLPIERDVDVPASGSSFTLPAKFGGGFEISATDARGLHLGGRFTLRDTVGGEHAVRMRATRSEGLPGELLAGATNRSVEILPAGDYELELDLGAAGVHRRRVQIAPREVAEVRVHVE